MTQTEVTPTAPLSGKWKSYPAYKDSGVEWLGKIPAHWETKRLKYVSYCLDGQRIPLNSEQRAAMQGIYPYWGANCIIDFVNRWLFNEELILLGEDGAPFFDPTKEVAFFVSGKIWVNNHAHVLRPKKDMNARFLAYALNMVDYRAYIDGSTRDKLTQNDMNIIAIQYPSYSEQCAIAAFLDYETAKINALIEKKERLIKLLQEKRAALISHAVTKGLDSTVPMKDSGVEWLGEIPEHWEMKRLKFVASILRGKFSHRPRNDPRFYDGPYPFIQTGDITATTKYITNYQQTLNELGFVVSKQFPNGTLVMAIAANIGDLAILQFPACFPDSIVGFLPTSEVALDYLYYNLTAMKQEMVSTATINTQLNLNVERIDGLFTTLPSIGEQHAIVVHLNIETAKIDALISRIHEGIEKLKEYSTALISAAVTGKIDVREIAVELQHSDMAKEHKQQQ